MNLLSDVDSLLRNAKLWVVTIKYSIVCMFKNVSEEFNAEPTNSNP